MKFYIYTLGCKVNQYESEAIAEKFEANGWQRTDGPSSADAIIVNSCSVTAESDRKARQTVRRFRKSSPKAVLLLCGCYPEGHKEEASSLDCVDIVVGNRDKNGIYEKVCRFLTDKKRTTDFEPVSRKMPFESMTVKGGTRTRAFIKIEDGCDSFCSYCIIPYVRGGVRSKKADDVVSEIKNLAGSGISEIVLSGIHLDKYRDGETDLTDLLERLDETEGNFRIRLSSLDPTYMTLSAIERLSKLKKLCPHFHLSLQSGSDAVLKRMNRKYLISDFERSVSFIYKYFEDASVTTDIITGFPGETDDDCNLSADAIRECRFLKCHVFPYSERPGTVAATLDGKVAVSVREQRAAHLSWIAETEAKKYMQEHIDKKGEMLVEIIKDGKAYGYTRQYIYTEIPSENVKVGDIVNVRMTSLCDEGMKAEIIG